MLACLALALSAGACAAQPVPAVPAPKTPAVTAPSAAAGAAFAIHDSVVRVLTHAVRDAPSSDTLGASRGGSGVVIGERLVLTIGYLVIESDTVEVVTSGGRKVPASVAGYDHETGFALLRSALPLSVPALELGDSDAVAERQKVLTLGFGETLPTELVIVSRKPFTGGWEYLLDRPLFTFPPVNNWSGSALLTHEGRLIGIGSLIVRDTGGSDSAVPGNLFVPVNLLKPILADLLARGRRSGPVRPWLGMATEMVRGHLMVTRVSPLGPAEHAGIGPGDIVVAVDGRRFESQADFYRALWSLGPAGTTVKLRLLRDGELQDVEIRSVDRSDVLLKPSGV